MVRTLSEELERLAAEAPTGGAAPDVVWAAGIRRRRTRRALAVTGGLMALLLVAGTGLLLGQRPGVPEAAAGRSEPHLPTQVNAPGPWSDEEGVDGPVAAIGLATRFTPTGLRGRDERTSLFTVSATTGAARWLDLPGADPDWNGSSDWFALSPDGGWIAWSTPTSRRMGEGLSGWSLLNTTTGEQRRLQVPGHDVVLDAGAALRFSGDSRFLLTSYRLPGSPIQRSHQFVAWDVQSGDPTVLEKPGRTWLPALGSAPTGVVWAHGSTVFRASADSTGHLPAARAASGDELASVGLSGEVAGASWGPDDTAFAWLAMPSVEQAGWHLYAGETMASARTHRIPTSGVEVVGIAGWTDARHVVVVDPEGGYHVVDVTTGALETVDLTGLGEPLTAPVVAADLWEQPRQDPVARVGVDDPRDPYWRAFGGLVLVAVGVVVFVVVRRRRG